MQTVYAKIPQIEDIPNRKRANFPDIIEDDFWAMYEVAKRYSMLHIPGFYNIYCSIRYVAAKRIPGDFVECGVWLVARPLSQRWCAITSG